MAVFGHFDVCNQLHDLAGNGFCVCEALAQSGCDNIDSAPPISLVASVPATFKLGKLARKVLLANVVKRANDPTLEKAVTAFRKVCVKHHATHKRLAVVKRRVVLEVIRKALIREVSVSDDECILIHKWLSKLLKRGLTYVQG